MMNEDLLYAKLTRLDALQSSCINCGLCAEVCTTFQESGWEQESPRGRIRLARDLMDGKISPESPALETFDHCVACRACETVCPTSVRYAELREIVQEIRSDPLPIKKGSTGRAYREWIAMARRLGSPFWRHYGSFWLFRKGGIVSPKNGSFAKKWGTSHPSSLANGKSIVLAIACVQDLFQHEVIASTLHVLQLLGYSVHIDKRQPCCGAIFERLVRGGRESIEHVSDRACALQLQEKCGKKYLKWQPMESCMLSRGCYEHVCSWGFKGEKVTFDICRFIAKELDARAIPLVIKKTMRVYYQPYCRSKERAESDSAYLLMRKISGLDLRLIECADACCGGYCGESALHSEHARQLIQCKIKNLEEDAIVVVASPDCHAHFYSHCKEKNSMQILHPMQILSQALSSS